MRRAYLAMALWILLAIVVFNVRFDWLTRMAGHAFVTAQLERQRQHLPPVSINDGFRPMVRNAAREAAIWLVAISAVGVTASAFAARRDKLGSS